MLLRIDVTPEDGNDTHSIHVEQDRALVGRATFSDVRLPFPIVSSRHLELERRDGRWFARDVGSSNGTELDGERMEPGTWCRVEEGSVADIVGLRLEFRYVDDLDGGLTLAQSGTLVRRLVQEAADRAFVDDVAFIEVVEGPASGDRVPLRDELERAEFGPESEPPLRGLPSAITVARDGDRFTLIEGAHAVNDSAFESPHLLRSGDRISVGHSVAVFHDPLEELLDGLDESPARPSESTEPSSEEEDSTAAPTSGDEHAPESSEAAGPSDVSAQEPAGAGDEQLVAEIDMSREQVAHTKERGLGLSEVALIVFSLAALVVGAYVLYILFGA